MSGRLVGIFGGTFDPIHNAHLRVALDAMEALPFAELRFIPSAVPPHRKAPLASAEQRLAMLQLAIADQAGFVADDRELRRAGPSYSFDTLHEITQQTAQPVCLLLGTDAFGYFHTWYRWREFLAHGHIVVMQRAGVEQAFNAELTTLIERHRVANPEFLQHRENGGIWFQEVTQLVISATEIRSRLAQRRSPRFLVPESVCEYLAQNAIY